MALTSSRRHRFLQSSRTSRTAVAFLLSSTFPPSNLILQATGFAIYAPAADADCDYEEEQADEPMASERSFPAETSKSPSTTVDIWQRTTSLTAAHAARSGAVDHTSTTGSETDGSSTARTSSKNKHRRSKRRNNPATDPDYGPLGNVIGSAMTSLLGKKEPRPDRPDCSRRKRLMNMKFGDKADDALVQGAKRNVDAVKNLVGSLFSPNTLEGRKRLLYYEQLAGDGEGGEAVAGNAAKHRRKGRPGGDAGGILPGVANLDENYGL